LYATLMVVDITTRYHFANYCRPVHLLESVKKCEFNVIIITAVIFEIVFNCAFVNAVLISILKNNS